MTFLQHFLNFFSRPPVPVITGTVTNHIINNLLDAPVVRILDRHYSNVTLESFMKYAHFNTVSEELYVPEQYDCDDFAFEFFVDVRRWAPMCPVGIVLGHDAKGNPHAWNCFVDIPNKHLMFMEPQSDTLFEPTTENVWEIII